MALIPFAVLLAAYQMGWYGFATIAPYCGVGFLDLLLPTHKPGQQNMSRLEFVDSFISGKAQQIPSKGCGSTGQSAPKGPPIGTPPPAAGVPNCPPGQTWVGDAANGGCVSGGVA